MKFSERPSSRAASAPRTGPLLRLASLSAVFGACALLATTAQATQLVHQNLSKMIRAADVIVSGEVIKVSDGIANGVPFTEISVKVKNSAKKTLAANSVYTFRQYGLLKARKLPDGRFMLPAKIEGMPSWTVGERVLSFMNKPASGTGLVTPVGLAQGKFTTTGTSVSNSFNNRALFEGVKVNADVLRPEEAALLAKTSGGIDASSLQHLVQRAVTEQWIEKGVMR